MMRTALAPTQHSPLSLNMSLEERTLVVRHFCDRVTRELLLELFSQAAPVLNVVHRQDFAFIEFEHKVSVGYALALFQGIHLFGQELVLEPKLRQDSSFYSFQYDMDCFNHVMALKPDYFLQYMPTDQSTSRGAQHSSRGQHRYEGEWSHRRQPYQSNQSYESYGEQNRYSERKRHSNDFRSFR